MSLLPMSRSREMIRSKFVFLACITGIVFTIIYIYILIYLTPKPPNPYLSLYKIEKKSNEYRVFFLKYVPTQKRGWGLMVDFVYPKVIQKVKE